MVTTPQQETGFGDKYELGDDRVVVLDGDVIIPEESVASTCDGESRSKDGIEAL